MSVVSDEGGHDAGDDSHGPSIEIWQLVLRSVLPKHSNRRSVPSQFRPSSFPSKVKRLRRVSTQVGPSSSPSSPTWHTQPVEGYTHRTSSRPLSDMSHHRSTSISSQPRFCAPRKCPLRNPKCHKPLVVRSCDFVSCNLFKLPTAANPNATDRILTNRLLPPALPAHAGTHRADCSGGERRWLLPRRSGALWPPGLAACLAMHVQWLTFLDGVSSTTLRVAAGAHSRSSVARGSRDERLCQCGSHGEHEMSLTFCCLQAWDERREGDVDGIVTSYRCDDLSRVKCFWMGEVPLLLYQLDLHDQCC